MAELIESISRTEINKLNKRQLRRLKSCEVTSDGEYVYTHINGNLEETGSIRINAEYLAQKGNTVGGVSLEEVTKELVEA